MTPSQIIKHYDLLKRRRQVWEPTWQDVADFVIPRKNDVQFTGSRKGEFKTTLYDSTAPHANELLASALHSMLTNPSLTWFELSTGDIELDKNDAVRGWLQDTARRIHNMLQNTNFHTEVHEMYLDLGSLGITIFRMEEDKEDVMRFQCKPIFEGYIDENSKGRVDTVYRKFNWTVRQVAQEWGKESLSEKLTKIYEADPLEEVELLHAVYPREDEFLDKKIGGKGKKYASNYIVIDEEHMLSEGGFDEFPYAIPRWTKTSGEIYGRSPAIKTMPTIKLANAMNKTTIRSAQKVTDPPLQAPDDGYSMPILSHPNALNYYRKGSKDRIEPILTGGRIDFGFQALQDVRQTIKDGFFIDQLQLRQGPQKTAEEVRQLTEENLRIFSPLLGRLGSEFLSPLIVRSFGVMSRKSLLAPPPEELSGANLQVRYSSMIAKAQRTGEGQNLGRAMQDVGVLIQQNPTVLQNIDDDKAIRSAMRLHGVSEDLIKSKEAVKKQRQEQAQAAQQQEQQAQQQAQQELAIKAQGAGGKGVQ